MNNKVLDPDDVARAQREDAALSNLDEITNNMATMVIVPSHQKDMGHEDS